MADNKKLQAEALAHYDRMIAWAEAQNPLMECKMYIKPLTKKALAVYWTVFAGITAVIYYLGQPW